LREFYFGEKYSLIYFVLEKVGAYIA